MLITYPYGLALTAGQPLSAWQCLNRLRIKAGYLESLAYRGRRATTEYIDQPFENYDANPTPLAFGSWLHRIGFTTLHVHVGLPVTSTLRVWLNETLVVNQSYAAGAHAITIAIHARGYADYQRVDMIVEVVHTGARGYKCYDAFVSPVSGVTGSAPSLPALFGSTLDSAALLQLGSAADWCMRVMATTLQSAFMGVQHMSFLDRVDQWTIWTGSISQSNGANRLMISVQYHVRTNDTEWLQVFISGSPVATSPTWHAGDYGWYLFDIDISGYAANAILDLRIVQVVTVAGSGAVLGSRYSLLDVYTQRASYPASTLPALRTPLETLSYGTLRTTHLHPIQAHIAAVISSIQAANDIFDRVRLSRWTPGIDAGQRHYFGAESRLRHAMGRRAHDVLWVAGRDVLLCYGPATAQPDRTPVMTWAYEERLTAQDAIETKRVAFDAFPGLFPGMPYAVVGADIRLVQEGWE
ncbi:MAG: hypothetical protein IPM06_17395 [Rhizobiales bacterium]|nr:hypothetical protein [Hyphomicrobiales bacterium]